MTVRRVRHDIASSRLILVQCFAHDFLKLEFIIRLLTSFHFDKFLTFELEFGIFVAKTWHTVIIC